MIRLVQTRKHLQYTSKTADSSEMRVLLKFTNDLFLKMGYYIERPS